MRSLSLLTHYFKNFYKKSLRWRVDNKNQHPELGTSAKITVLKFARFLIKINSSWTMFV